jgi:hypothetical protein
MFFRSLLGAGLVLMAAGSTGPALAQSATQQNSDVAVAATWAGFILGIVSIVLAGVSMVFTYVVNLRSDRVTEQSIKTLQQIESAVGRTSDDMRELIRVGWDKLLSGLGERTRGTSEVENIAGGLAGELREALGIQKDSQPDGDLSLSADKLRHLEELLSNQEQMIQSLLRRGTQDEFSLRPSEGITFPRTRALAQLLRNRHLTEEQYKKLQKDSYMRDPIVGMRRAGLLVPFTSPEDGQVVYWFPSRAAARDALLLRTPAPGIVARVRRKLEEVGYNPDLDEEPDDSEG